jgi:hypothetical protein
MRLTVHLSNAKKETVSVPSKEKPGTFIKKKKLMNTLSFTDVQESDLGRILSYIEDNELGTVEKHFFSNDKVAGMARVKKKK